MKIYLNGQVAHYKEIFPNVSFPAGGPSDEFLASAGAYKVSLFREHNRATQKLVSCDPVVENGFAYLVEVVDKTAEEIAADLASKSAQVRRQRDIILAQSDWMVVKSAETGIAIAEEWAIYRQALRDITAQESFPEVSWPTSPDAQAEQPE